MDNRPQTAPPCWSRQYEEGDKECQECSYRVTCKQAFLRNNGMAPPQHYTAPIPPQPAWNVTPPQVYVPPPAPTVRLPMYTPSATVPPPPPVYYHQQYAQPQYQQPQQPVNSPYWAQHTINFNQYYTPYDGEGTAERVGKHIALKLAEVFFSELSRFFQLWRWPPNK